MLFREYTKSKGAFFLNVNFLELVFGVSNHEVSFSLTVLEAKSEVALVDHAILVDFSSNTLSEAIDEPALINVGISAVSASLILEDSTETMIGLCVHQHLSIINEVVDLLDAHQLQLESIRSVNLGRLVRVLDVVEWWQFLLVDGVTLDPVLVDREELTWNGPGLELYELITVLAKVFGHDLAVEQFISRHNLLLPLSMVGPIVGFRLLSDSRWTDREVVDEVPLGVVDEAVVAEHALTLFALVDGTVPLVLALVALLLDLVVRLVEDQLRL